MSAINTFTQIKNLLATPELPELGPGPRAGVQPSGALNQQVDRYLDQSALSESSRELICATVLLWHDHLDAAHTIAQSTENADGSYVHGIMHRREPDYGNAKYWFRRVGQHPCFAELSGKAAALLRAKKENALETKLLPHGRWDPFAFIDACESVAGRPASDAQVQLLRALQAGEFEILLQHFCRE